MKSKQNFQDWCTKKISIEEKSDRKIVKNGEFWTFDLGINIGGEMSVEKPFVRAGLILNAKIPGDLVLIIPLSTKINDAFMKEQFYREVEDFESFGLKYKSYFIVNQVKLISRKRLIKRLGKELGFKKYNSEKRDLLKKEYIKNIVGYFL